MDTTKIVEKIKYGNVELKMKTTTLQAKSVDPSVDEQFVFPDSEYGGLSSVTVTGVTNSIDKNIIPGNIRKGKVILGVEGDMEPDKPDQSKTIKPTKEEQEVHADRGYELLSVTVEGVTSDVDENIQPDNIRYGVEILGVVGSMEQKEDLDAELNAQESLLSDLQSQVDSLDEIDLNVATATESDVIKGKTFFSGDNEIKTGTLEVPDLSATTATAEDVLQGKKFYNAQGEFVEGTYISTDKLKTFLSGSELNITASDLAGANKIRDYGFYYYPNKLNVTIPSNITEIGSSAFYRCQFNDFTIEENSQLSKIGGSAFAYSNIKSVYIPKTVETMGSSVFSDCKSIESIVFEQGCKIQQIPKYAFDEGVTSDYKKWIQMVDLSPCTQLTTIKSQAFSNNGIYNMILPSTITTIENYGLPFIVETVTVLATTPPSLAYNINQTGKLKTVYIPKGTLSAYQSATNWSSIASKFVELEA